MSNNFKIEKWKVTNKDLYSFIKNKNIVNGDELRKWIAGCIVHFTEIGVNESIIEYFLFKLEYRKVEIEIKSNTRFPSSITSFEDDQRFETKSYIGPFPFNSDKGGYIINNQDPLIEKADPTLMTPILVAFQISENIINNYEEDERIIPNYIIKVFDKDDTQNIYNSLKSVQTNYEKRDVKNILTSLVSSTELILSLIPELKSIDKLNQKMIKLYDEKNLYNRYKIKREVIWGLNNSRIIRNYNIHDPKKEDHTTMYEAVGYCHLLVFLICSIFVSGEVNIIKD